MSIIWFVMWSYALWLLLINEESVIVADVETVYVWYKWSVGMLASGVGSLFPAFSFFEHNCASVQNKLATLVSLNYAVHERKIIWMEMESVYFVLMLCEVFSLYLHWNCWLYIWAYEWSRFRKSFVQLYWQHYSMLINYAYRFPAYHHRAMRKSQDRSKSGTLGNTKVTMSVFQAPNKNMPNYSEIKQIGHSKMYSLRGP